MSDKILRIIVGVFDKTQHTRPYLRNIYEFLPGKPLREWKIEQAIGEGNMYIIEHLNKMGKLTKQPPSKYFTEHWLADNAACCGHVHVIEYLRQHHDIHCSQDGANRAAWNGHLHVLRHLQQYGIQCTSRGATHAVSEDHLHVVKYLQQYNIHCARSFIQFASKRAPQFRVVKYFQEQMMEECLQAAWWLND